MFFTSLRTTGASSFSCDRSSDEQNSLTLICEQFWFVFITTCGNTFREMAVFRLVNIRFIGLHTVVVLMTIVFLS